MAKELILEYEGRKIQLITNENNIGFANNCNKLAENANGEYIIFFHSDDRYSNDICELSIELLKTNNLDATFSKMERLYGNLKTESVNYPDILNDGNIYLGSHLEFCNLFMEYGNFIACPSFFIKKDVFINVGGFTDKYYGNEDIDLWCRLLCEHYKFGIINKVLMQHTISSNQYTEQMRKLKYLSPMYNVLEDYFLKKNISSYAKIKFYKNKAIGFLNAAYNCYRDKDFENAKINIDMSKSCYKFKLHDSLKMALYQRYTYIYYKLSRVKNG